ncbi:hypothetical protein RYA05_00195 [Pseudomonas syringae pv. actinidiae]|nr:hypothetical protein [Pseudomonas syringae pv. actinidiae]
MKQLLEIAKILDEEPHDTPDRLKRLAESRERMRLYDEKLVAIVKAKRPTPELLNKTCSL